MFQYGKTDSKHYWHKPVQLTFHYFISSLNEKMKLFKTVSFDNGSVVVFTFFSEEYGADNQERKIFKRK